MSKSSGEIEQAINELATEFQRTIKAELVEAIKMLEAEDPSEDKSRAAKYIRKMLHNVAESNRSNWSGGNSVSNMAEQIRRTVALDLMRKYI